ncbi:MAG TPA: hypothetical protein VGM88_04450 [Kofleriaceae bacterium]
MPLLVAGIALADPPKSADDWYKEGETQYNLGDFQKAVDAFKQGFSVETVDSKKPAYIYNIAQSYRLAKDCSNSQFFYKRYLSLKDADTAKPLSQKKRDEVDNWIKEAQECMDKQTALQSKQPSQTMNPSDATKPEPVEPKKVATNGTDAATGDDEPTTIEKHADNGQPHVLAVRLVGGGSKVSFGGGVSSKFGGTGGLIIGYPIAVSDQFVIEIGGALTVTPASFSGDTGGSSSVQLYGAMLNGGFEYWAAPKVGIRADVGVGALLLNGAGDTALTMGANTTGGALAMLHVRGGLSADYAVTPNLVITVAPIAFGYSPAKSGLVGSTITELDFMVGVGYRM